MLDRDKHAVDEDDYASPDWEEHVGRYPVKVAVPPGGPIEPRTIVVGVTLAGKSKAWPHASVIAAGATIDQLADVPLALVVAPDGRSVRVFDRRVNGQALTFVRAGTAAATSVLLDLETMSEWDFAGKAQKGELAGAQLKTVDYLLDYWFDWKTYHPDTAVVKQWEPIVKRRQLPEIPRPDGTSAPKK